MPDARRLQRRGLLGEVVGPSGAGKTTLLRALVRRNPDVVPDLPLTKLEQLPHYARNAALLMPTFLRRPRGAFAFTWTQARAMAYLRAWHEPARRLTVDDGRLVVMDQGPLYRLAFLQAFAPPTITGSSAFREWWESSCAQWTATLGILIYLDAPDAILIQRVRERDRFHAFKKRSEPDVRVFLARYRQAFEDLIRRFEAPAGGAVVLRLDSERGSLDGIVNQVLEALEERASAV
jgi:thymidylate kinase